MTISTPKQRPVPKAQLLTYIIGLVMVVLFVCGLIRYPDLPIRECPSGYCGRQGQPHTAAENRAFNAWQITLMIGWPIGIAALLFLQREKLKGGSK
jgi:hypothetical protein